MCGIARRHTHTHARTHAHARARARAVRHPDAASSKVRVCEYACVRACVRVRVRACAPLVCQARTAATRGMRSRHRRPAGPAQSRDPESHDMPPSLVTRIVGPSRPPSSHSLAPSAGRRPAAPARARGSSALPPPPPQQQQQQPSAGRARTRLPTTVNLRTQKEDSKVTVLARTDWSHRDDSDDFKIGR